MPPRNDFKAHKPGDRATMPLLNNSKVRKPAIRKPKSSWENHKPTIIELYRNKTLEEVIQVMESTYDFRGK